MELDSLGDSRRKDPTDFQKEKDNFIYGLKKQNGVVFLKSNARS